MHGGYSKEERLARSAIGKKTNKAYIHRSNMKDERKCGFGKRADYVSKA